MSSFEKSSEIVSKKLQFIIPSLEGLQKLRIRLIGQHNGYSGKRCGIVSQVASAVGSPEEDHPDGAVVYVSVSCFAFRNDECLPDW